MKIVKIIVFALFGLLFIQAGADKLFHFMPTPELTEVQKKSFEAFMQIAWLMPLVAVIEILGGVLIAIPRFRALGAIVILPIIVGIFLHHTVVDRSAMIFAIVLAAINIWAIADNYKKYEALIK
jgi:putative oxidoreductase